jgi:hypothetical protein
MDNINKKLCIRLTAATSISTLYNPQKNVTHSSTDDRKETVLTIKHKTIKQTK